MAFDREKIRQKIAVINEKISGEADPRLLNEYRVLFKKEISFFRRSWAAAYLLMLHDLGPGAGNSRKGPGPRSKARGEGEGKKPTRRAEGSEKRDGEENIGRTAAPRPLLAEEESRRLFISIGRNRRVFPREILGLIITRAQVVREDIGMIRILDSYSFVQVRDTAADAIIEALNGTVFRGRTITVNYARLKREEGQDEGESGETGAAPGDVDSVDGDPIDLADAEPIDSADAGLDDAGSEDIDSVDAGPVDSIEPADFDSSDSIDEISADEEIFIDEEISTDEVQPEVSYPDGRAESAPEMEDYPQDPEDDDGLEHDDDLGDKEGV